MVKSRTVPSLETLATIRMNWLFKRKIKSSDKSETLSSKQEVAQIWLDDIAQEELLHEENKQLILDEFKIISNIDGDVNGFTEIHERKLEPHKLINQEIRTDYLVTHLDSCGFKKCNKIRLEKGRIKSFNESKYKVLKSDSMKIHFMQEGEFLSVIWISVSLIVTVSEFDRLLNVLYELGEDNDLILVDWFKLEIIDLKNKVEIKSYLMTMFK